MMVVEMAIAAKMGHWPGSGGGHCPWEEIDDHPRENHKRTWGGRSHSQAAWSSSEHAGSETTQQPV